MEIEISQKTRKLIEKASKELNLDSETTITIAIESYLKSNENSELKEELEIWENASNEDLDNFNKENGI